MTSQRGPGPVVPARLGRSLALASSSAALAWLAHAVGGGALPDGWLLLPSVALVAALAFPLLGGEASWWQIAAGLAGAQGLLHGWLSITASHPAHHGGHGSTGRMLIAHAVATLVAVIWLRYGERRLWDRAREAWVALILRQRRWLAVPAVHRPPPACVPCRRPAVIATEYLVTAFGTRGPPVPVGP